MTHIVINDRVRIPESEIEVAFTTSGGPGGQHANRSATAVRASLHLAACSALRADDKQRLIDRLGPIVTVTASDSRSQRRNREIAIERLAARVRGALRVRKPRKQSQPSWSARQRRMDAKRRRGEIKSRRGRVRRDDVE